MRLPQPPYVVVENDWQKLNKHIVELLEDPGIHVCFRMHLQVISEPCGEFRSGVSSANWVSSVEEPQVVLHYVLKQDSSVPVPEACHNN